MSKSKSPIEWNELLETHSNQTISIIADKYLDKRHIEALQSNDILKTINDDLELDERLGLDSDLI